MRLFKVIESLPVVCCMTSDDEPEQYSRHSLKVGTVLRQINEDIFTDCQGAITYYTNPNDIDKLQEIENNEALENKNR